MQEIIRFEHTPHPVEFEMYYSAGAGQRRGSGALRRPVFFGRTARAEAYAWPISAVNRLRSAMVRISLGDAAQCLDYRRERTSARHHRRSRKCHKRSFEHPQQLDDSHVKGTSSIDGSYSVQG
jgi:hypothetical protein